MKSYLQSEYWAAFKHKQGWHSHEIEGHLILQKKIPLNRCILYAPEPDEGVLKPEILAKINQIAKDCGAIFFKLEMLEKKSSELEQKLLKAGFRRSFEDLQPATRQWIDLRPSEAEILTQMKSKGRYNIRLAERKGVKIVEKTNEEGATIFYNLLVETSDRDDFTIRPKSYFTDLAKLPHLIILVAEFEGKPIASLVLTTHEGIGLYLYGASSNQSRNLMAPYLIQWEAMKRAKAAGCVVYDLLAIAPSEDEKHKWAGLRDFKQKFGGKEIHLVGAYDRVYSRIFYRIYKIYERQRRHL